MKFTSEYQPQIKWTEDEALRLANDFISWLKEEDENIFLDDFLFLCCDENKYAGKIYSELPNYLCGKYESFLNLHKKALKIQETKLKKFSLFDKINPTITKFVLINCHGWKERNETDLTTNGKEINGRPIINFTNGNNPKREDTGTLDNG